MPSPVRTGSLATRFLTPALALAVAGGLLVASSERGPGTEPAAAGTDLASSGVVARVAAAAAPRTRIPGNFRGYGFDQCLAPEQWKMNKWLNHSPFMAVGIYISGDSRACRNQPNLSRAWVRTQRQKGWRLLPIALGPQASCQPRFPRYRDDFKISPRPGSDGKYRTARRQGRAEAEKNVADAKKYGIPANSVLWYDLEGFNYSDTHCRESALAFISAWTWQIRQLNYVSGMYSSAGSGIKMVDEARVKRPGRFNLPEMLWIARWDGKANTSTEPQYLREDGWRPGRRVKQYRGGHNETHGGVTINIDSNFLDVGRGIWTRPETRCGGVRIGFRDYPSVHPKMPDGTTADPRLVSALKCLLTEKEMYSGPLGGHYTPRLNRAVHRWQRHTGFPVWDGFSRRNWMTIFGTGPRKVKKYGTAGPAVRRAQRALNAAFPDRSVKANGRFRPDTHRLVRVYQRRVGMKQTGIVTANLWKKLAAGER